MRACRWVCGLLAVALTVGSCPADEPEGASAENLTTLDALRRRVADRNAAVKTVRIRFRTFEYQYVQGRDGLVKGSDGKPQVDETATKEKVFTWWRSGNREKLVMDPFVDKQGKPGWPLFLSFDGQLGYQENHWPDGSGVMMISRTNEFPHMLRNNAPKFVLGARMFGHRLTFDNLLLRPAARLAGSELVHGVRCQKVDLGTDTWGQAGLQRVTAWYDLEHGALLRQYLIDRERQPGDESKPKRTRPPMSSGSLQELQEVSNPLTEKTEWWPRRILIPVTDRTEVSYEEIVLNEAMPASTFVPEFPVGVEISDRRNGREVKSQIVGGDAALEARAVKFRQLSKPPEALNPTPAALATASVSGRPVTTTSLPLWIFGGSVVVLLASLWLVWRRTR